MDVQQRETGTSEREELIMITFIGAAIISFVRLYLANKKETFKSFKQTKSSCIFLFISSFAAAFAVNFLVIALEYIDVAVLYTIDNSAVFLISALCSCIFFKEKMSLLNVIGCITTCLALVGVSLL